MPTWYYRIHLLFTEVCKNTERFIKLQIPLETIFLRIKYYSSSFKLHPSKFLCDQST